ncbi:hypothetical protein B9Z65_3784 [Elsinoe australis]|uniref:Alginate lyase domain-containing protein n=1 Tax=Elsinoe australis TaxID=40998 RepID=A0A2P8AG60_9PEZI|nr:hypothetical protein B9Z65_3784 [Elsinoe australis]
MFGVNTLQLTVLSRLLLPSVWAQDQWVNSSSAFKHPGVLLSQSQLDFVADRIAAADQPWTLAYADMTGETLAALSRKPNPVAVVECGPFSTPDIGCAPERSDAAAAYLNALRWVIEGKQEHANKAIEYMDAWSGNLTGHLNVNAGLQAAWSASVWTRAAEIIRYTNAGWSNAGISRFESLMRDIYLPQVSQSTDKGMNWELVLIEATIHIGVFLNDGAVFSNGLDRLTTWAPAFVYLQSDGALPKPPPFMANTTSVNQTQLFAYWGGQTTFQADGITTETCQEMKRVGYGITAISHALETAYIQDVDLWSGSDLGGRLQAASDFNIEQADAASTPTWLCEGKGVDTTDIGGSTEIVLNAMHNRLSVQMWKTESHTNRNRPMGANYLNLAWETLTHAGWPAA